MDVDVTLFNIPKSHQIKRLDDLLVDSRIKHFGHLSLETKFDDILLACAKECNINPLYLPLFGLRKRCRKWVSLGAQLSSQVEGKDACCEGSLEDHFQHNRLDLEFRVRFIFDLFKHADGGRTAIRHTVDQSAKPVMSAMIITYIFHQCRYDFLSGKLPCKEITNAHLTLLNALGVAVIDLFRLAFKAKTSLEHVRTQISYKKLLPKKIQKEISGMKFLRRWRTKLRFKHYIKHFRSKIPEEHNCEISYFHLAYLKCLNSIASALNVETYQAVVENGRIGSVPQIDQYRQVGICADNGIFIGNVEASEPWCNFHNIIDMQIQTHKTAQDDFVYVVHISKNCGKSVNVLMRSLEDAHSLTSGIDGYYQLLADAHHFLCRDVASPSLVERLSFNCHGPISVSDAENLLRKQSQLQIGNCLLRQSQDCYDEYYVNAVVEVSPAVVIQNYKLDRVDGKLGIYGDNMSHTYDTLSSFVKAYDDNTPAPFRISQCVLPSQGSLSVLKVYRSSDLHEANKQGIANFQASVQMAVIPQRDYHWEKDLGSGFYTRVYLYQHVEERKRKLVMKKTYDPRNGSDLRLKHSIESAFEHSRKKMSLLKNDYIVQLIGVMSHMTVLEYVPQGSLSMYLQKTAKHHRSNPQLSLSSEWNGWLLHVLYQFAHACSYLEENGYAHGNIKGNNLLLLQDEPMPHIKLADNGVTTICSTADSRPYEPCLQIPWLAAEFCDGVGENYPSIQGDKWSFATTVWEIHNWGHLPVIPCCAHRLHPAFKEKYQRGENLTLPTLFQGCEYLQPLLQECWSFKPSSRPLFKKILREISVVLTEEYVLSSVHIATGQSSAVNISSSDSCGSNLVYYDDKLLHHIRCLGGGHFGEVDLNSYDPYGGRRQEVAVKSLRRSFRDDAHAETEFRKEIVTMRYLNHRHLVKLMGIAVPSLRIVMEFVEHGSFLSYLRTEREKHVPLSSHFKMLFEFCSQITQGMIVLQDKRIIHRDLALRNILLAQDHDSGTMYVKVSDFGLSRTLKDDYETYVGDPSAFPAEWYAPECFPPENRFLFASDVWSFGVTVWEVFSYCEHPVYEGIQRGDLSRLQRDLRNGRRLPQTQQCPPNVYALMLSCWKLIPSDRAKFEELQKSFHHLTQSFCG